MPKSSSVTIGGQLADFIERQVAEGRYSSASDVVAAGLQLLQERESKLEALRAALIEGEESGDPAAFDFDEFLGEMRSSRDSSR